jgi:hypothetical protein
MDLSLLQPISQFAAAIGVCVAAVYYVMNLRISQKNQELSLKTQELALKAQQQSAETRQAQLLMQIFNLISDKDFQKDYMETVWGWKFDNYDEYIQKYGSKPDKVAQLTHVLSTYEGIGTLLQNKLVDPKMLYQLLGWPHILSWEKFGPVMKEWGKRTGEPKMYPGSNLLYVELNAVYEADHGYKYGHKIRSDEEALASLKAGG